MLGKKNECKRQILNATLVIMGIAMVLSICSTVFASNNNNEVASFRTMGTAIIKGSEDVPEISVSEFLSNTVTNTGLNAIITGAENVPDLVDPAKTTTVFGWQRLLLMVIGFLIIYLGAAKGFEPLLLIIFMGIGAMTDFGPLLANPKTALLGGAAQLGVFITLFGVALMNLIPGVDYNMFEACAIAIIGGADGPTSIYVSGKLAPHMMAVIAVAAYSYMALVPMIQPPIMKLLTTDKERHIKMKQLRPVSKAEKILFPVLLLILAILFIPAAAPLIGMLAFGNFVKQCGVVDRLSKTMENELLNIVSILLSLGVGSQMTPEKIMNLNAVGIIILGLIAFAIATAGGVLMAKLMNLFLKEKINPLIGSAGVSAVPMAARVSNKVGMEYDPSNFLLMHAMGPNVAGVIGTAIAAGVFIATYAG